MAATHAGKRAAKKSTPRGGTRWSQGVTKNSDALTLAPKVFTLRSASAVAHSLLQSARRSRRRKSSAFRSAMSMLTFYINRAGRGLSASRLRVLQRAKDELRKQASDRDRHTPATH